MSRAAHAALLTLTFVLPATNNDRFVGRWPICGRLCHQTRQFNLRLFVKRLSLAANAADGTIFVVGMADDGSLVVGNYTNTL